VAATRAGAWSAAQRARYRQPPARRALFRHITELLRRPLVVAMIDVERARAVVESLPPSPSPDPDRRREDAVGLVGFRVPSSQLLQERVERLRLARAVAKVLSWYQPIGQLGFLRFATTYSA
jgi:hypothetical protein